MRADDQDVRVTAGFAGPRRLVVDVVLLLAVVLAIVLLIRGSGSSTAASHAPTAAEVASATRWLRGAMLPAGAVRDRSDTACFVAVELCVISDHTVRLLADELESALRTQGGATATVSCDRSPLSCLFLVRYGGAKIAVQIHALAGYREGTSVALATIQDDMPPAQVTKPLPPASAVHAIPSDLHVRLHCVQRAGGGCHAYAGAFQRRADAGRVATTWRSMLQAAGWLLVRHPCVNVSSHRRCFVSAVRSVAPNGGRFISIIAGLDDRGERGLTGELQLFALG